MTTVMMKTKTNLLNVNISKKEDSQHTEREYQKAKESFLCHISNGKQANNNSLESYVLSNF